MKTLSKTQRQMLRDMISDVNSEGVTSLPSLLESYAIAATHPLLDWPIYSAGENMPGYMPDSPYCLFATEREARGYCRELEREEGHREGGYVSDWMPVTLREVLSQE